MRIIKVDKKVSLEGIIAEICMMDQNFSYRGGPFVNILDKQGLLEIEDKKLNKKDYLAVVWSPEAILILTKHFFEEVRALFDRDAVAYHIETLPNKKVDEIINSYLAQSR